MGTNEVLATALLAMTVALVIAALYAIFVLVRAVRDLMVAVEQVRSRLVPLLDKLDVTVDAANAELLRVDAIVTRAEDVGEAVAHASDFIRSPVNKAAQGIARAVRSLAKR